MAENCRLTSLLAPWESSPSIRVTVRMGGSEMRRVPGGMSYSHTVQYSRSERSIETLLGGP